MIRERRSEMLPGVLAAWAALAAAMPVAVHGAEFTLLPMTEASAVSPDGRFVAGCAATPHAACGEAAVWREPDGLIRLGGLPPASVASRAHDVADDGTVVGESRSSTGRTAAVRWSGGGEVRELVALPGASPFARARAVSADGARAAGLSAGLALGYVANHAVSWAHGDDPGAAPRAMGHLPGDRGARGVAPFAEALDLSADGSVAVGWSGVWPGGGRHRAFRREAGGSPEYLGGLLSGDGYGEARGVSADGAVVVGVSRSAQGLEAFLWSAAEGMRGLGDLPGGEFRSAAHAVSADGRVVVGAASTAAHDGGAAFVWTPAHALRALARVLRDEYCVDLGGARLLAALDVSADGRVIVGAARDAQGRPRGFRAVLDYAPGTNRAPVARADSYWAMPGATLAVAGPVPAPPPPAAPSPGACPPGIAPAAGALRNDRDPEGHPLTAELVDGVAHGTLALGADGGFRYTPEPGFVGRDGFSYRASDGRAHSAPARVDISVGNTHPGTDVDVAPGGDVRLRFARVAVGGHTTLGPAPDVAPPDGFLPAARGAAWAVRSSAVYLGPVRFTAGYDETALAAPESGLRMLHYRDGLPALDAPPGRLTHPDPAGNVTVALDTGRDRVSGEMRDPSVVALVVAEPAGGGLLPGIVLVLLVGAALLMLVWLSHMRAAAQG